MMQEDWLKSKWQGCVGKLIRGLSKYESALNQPCSHVICFENGMRYPLAEFWWECHDLGCWIYDVLHAVNKMYDSGNDDDGDGDDAAREGERERAGSRRGTRTKTEEFH